MSYQLKRMACLIHDYYYIHTDINECAEQPEVCDQLCLNLIGSYRCDCTAGYRLIGSSSCIGGYLIIKTKDW